jgi:hypothetical protein
MKKVFTSIIVLLLFAWVPAFAQVDIDGPHHTLGIGSNAQAGATASATGGSVVGSGNSSIIGSGNSFTDIDLTFRPTNINSNIQGQGQDQDQKQKQGQAQGQLQGQMFDWTQIFEAPRDLLPAPGISPTEIHILPGKMWRMKANEIPNIGIAAYNGEEYVEAKSYNGSIFNRVRDEDLAEDLLEFKARILKREGWSKENVRISVNVRDAGESNTTSGGGGGGYSANPTPGSGVSGALSMFPGKARWKADYQYNVVFYLLKYTTAKKAASINYEKEGWKKVESKSTPTKKVIFGKEVSD